MRPKLVVKRDAISLGSGHLQDSRFAGIDEQDVKLVDGQECLFGAT